MDFIQSSNKQVDKFGVGKHGFSAGNPVGGILATYFTNLWADGVQQEIINVIEAAGLAPTGASLNQMLSAIGLLTKGRLIARRVFNTTGTYTATAGTAFVDVTVIGAGGGGGSAAPTAAGNCSAGPGGGGGGWAKKRITASFNGVTMTIGAGGAAGATGGTTSFGALVSAAGGGGGAAGGGAAYSSPSVNGFTLGGSGSGGDVNGTGGYGNYAVYVANPVSGAGGASLLGAGAGYVNATTTTPGIAGTLAGAGGSGGANAQSQAGAAVGGAGAPGLIIVEEYA